MIFPLNKRKIISILFIAALIILLANLVLNKFYPTETKKETYELPESEIHTTFLQALSNLGVKEEWIRKKNKDENNFSIRIPEDLPAILILREMNELFDTSEVKIKSVEKKIGGSTTIYINSGGEEKLKADLIHNNKVRRKVVRVGFILDYKIDNENDIRLLGYPEQFAFALLPSTRSADFVKKVAEYNKEYIVYLNDDIDELKYKLSDSYSPVRIKNSIREIVGTFPGAVFFLINNNSSLYNSGIYPLLKEELEKRNIKLIEENNFIALFKSSKGETLMDFNKVLDNLEGGEDKIFIIPADNFLQVASEITRYRKLGYRFTNPSALLDTYR